MYHRNTDPRKRFIRTQIGNNKINPRKLIEDEEGEYWESPQHQKELLDYARRKANGRNVSVNLDDSARTASIQKHPHKDEFQINIPTRTLDNPTSYFTDEEFHTTIHYAWILHEIGHYLYSDLSSIKDELEKTEAHINDKDTNLNTNQLLKLSKFLWNAIEDGFIENELSGENSTYIKERLDFKNQTYIARPSRQIIGSGKEHTVTQALKDKAMDISKYDTGVYRRLVDPDDDSVQFGSDEAEECFFDIEHYADAAIEDGLATKNAEERNRIIFSRIRDLLDALIEHDHFDQEQQESEDNTEQKDDTENDFGSQQSQPSQSQDPQQVRQKKAQVTQQKVQKNNPVKQDDDENNDEQDTGQEDDEDQSAEKDEEQGDGDETSNGDGSNSEQNESGEEEQNTSETDNGDQSDSEDENKDEDNTGGTGGENDEEEQNTETDTEGGSTGEEQDENGDENESDGTDSESTDGDTDSEDNDQVDNQQGTGQQNLFQYEENDTEDDTDEDSSVDSDEDENESEQENTENNNPDGSEGEDTEDDSDEEEHREGDSTTTEEDDSTDEEESNGTDGDTQEDSQEDEEEFIEPEGTPSDPAINNEPYEPRNTFVENEKKQQRDNEYEQNAQKQELEEELEEFLNQLDTETNSPSDSSAPGDIDEIDINVTPSAIEDSERWDEAEQNKHYAVPELKKQLMESRRDNVKRGVRSGRLDSKRISQIGAKQLNVMERRESGDEKKYKVIVVLDRSGSMSGKRIELAERALAEFGLALEELNIEVCVMDMYGDRAAIVSPFSQPMEESKDQIMSRETAGGTPLTDAITLAKQRVQHEAHDVIPLLISITDGNPDNPDDYKDIIETIRFPVLGITINERHSGPNTITSENEFYDAHTTVGSSEQLTRSLEDLILQINF